MTNTWQISETISSTALNAPVAPKSYGVKTLNGDILPWRLSPRSIPLPEESHVVIKTVRACHSNIALDDWTAWLSGSRPLTLT